MAPPSPLTPPRRAIAAAIAFLLSGALAGVTLTPEQVGYRAFGFTEGIFALFLVFVLRARGAWSPVPGIVGWLAIGYGAWATAQIAEALLPPPGMLEWVVVTGLALSAWATLGGGSRERLMASLASLALLLALLRYSVIPILWNRAGPRAGEAFGLGDLAESMRQLVVEYQPVRPGGQVLGVVAIALWALGTRLIWPEVEAE